MVYIAVGRKVPTIMQTYGKISNFKDFYKIHNILEKSQTWHGNCLDH